MKNVVISDGVTTICNSAFSDFYYVKNVTIPDGITLIGDDAFYKCNSLRNITIPNSVTTIGDYAFSQCLDLLTITIGSGVSLIGNNAFSDCYSLIKFDVDSNNQCYSNDDFGVLFNKDKTTLIQYPADNTKTSYTIPNTVTLIGKYAFFNCCYLTSVTIPDSVLLIDKSFMRCYSLTNFIVDSSNQYYSSDEYGVLFNKNKTTLIQYPAANTRTSYTIPNNVTSIDEYAFLASDIENVTIPDSATTIGKYAFESCRSLTSVTIGDSVTSIGYGAFYECRSLTSATIPVSVTSIDEFAFYNCTSLTDVYYGGTEEQWNAVSIDSYNECLTNATIHYNSTGPDSNNEICSMCGGLYEILVLAPTCTMTGGKTYTCSSCDNTYTEEVPALGHDMQETTAAVAPTCKTAGSTAVYTCANGCGNTEGGEEVAATGHNIVNGVCFVCGYSEINSNKKYYIGDREFDKNIDYYTANWNSSSYNPTLSNMLAVLSAMAYNETDIIDAYYSLGFNNVSICDYNVTFNPMSSGCAISFKKSNYNNDTICLITVRGSIGSKLTGSDWIGNYSILTLDNEKHVGFSFPANRIYENIKKLSSERGITGNVKYVLTGHSRGAAVANLLAVKLMENGVDSANIYDYNFATPDVACKYSFPNYNNIFNLCNRVDIVPLIPGNLASIFTSPGTAWGKFGRTYWFTEETEDAHSMDTYLSFLDQKLNLSDWPYDAADKNWDDSQWLSGWLAKVFCPVDVIITDEEGKNIASVINGEVNYYDSTLGDVIIFTDGDKKVIYINGENNFNVNLIGTDNGTMTYSIEKGNFVTGEIYESKTFSDVVLEDGKTMYSPVSEAKETDDVQLLVAEEKNGEKIYTHIINEDGTEEIFYDLSIQSPSRTEIRNKDGIILHANIEGTAPAGSYVVWTSSNGNFDEDADGNNLTVIAESKGYTTFTAILCAEDGTELARDSVELYSKSGFFDKIGGFFRSLFGSTKIHEN